MHTNLTEISLLIRLKLLNGTKTDIDFVKRLKLNQNEH